MHTEIHGVKLHNRHDVVVSKFLKKGDYEPLLMKAWERTAAEARLSHSLGDSLPTMLDVGAYSGLFAIKAKLVGGAGVSVHAFELHPVTANMLKNNARLNGVDISIHEEAVWKENTDLTAYTFADRVASSSATVVRQGGREFKVKARTLDSYGFTDVTAIKVDAERAEYEVVLGATGLIEAYRPVIFTEVLDSDIFSRLNDFLTFFGYSSEVLDPNMIAWSTR